ncbi:hypothetical protein FOG51_02783 [Hanseniaspora uvarum]|nr:hypothetical protein FOG51_02783 [Hanseniaspora uvarum]
MNTNSNQFNSRLSDDINKTLHDTLLAFSSANNEIRTEAERYLFSNWIQADSIETLLVFLAENSVNPNSSISQLSAVLYRKVSLRSPVISINTANKSYSGENSSESSGSTLIAKNISSIPKTTLVEIRNILLHGFMDKSLPSMLKHKVSDAISVTCLPELPDWPDLIQTLFTTAILDTTSSSDTENKSNIILKESSFRILSSAPHLVTKISIENTISLFKNGFNDESKSLDDAVKVSAVTAFVNYFKEMDKSQWANLSVLLPDLLNSLPVFLDSGNDQALAAVIDPLIELVDIAPKLFQKMFDDIIRFCDYVIKDTNISSEARISALELISVFSERAPKMCSESEYYGTTAIFDCLLMISDIPDDEESIEDWLEADDETPIYGEDKSEQGRQCLDNLSLKLGGVYLVPYLFKYIEQMLVSNDWREVYGALMGLSAAAEGSSNVLENDLVKLVQMVVPMINHPHPRVQFAACNTLGQFCTDFAPLIIEQCHQLIAPALISKINKNSCDRVCTHAAAAMVNFSEPASKEIMTLYMDSLLQGLSYLLVHPKKYIQEQGLTSIAYAASAAGKKFEKYYDSVMPALFDILANNGFKLETLDADQKKMVGKCIESISIITASCGRERFEPYHQKYIEILLTIQNQLEVADQEDAAVMNIKNRLEQCWARLCKLLKQDFVPLLKFVLPSLLTTAKSGQTVSIIEEEEAEKYNQQGEWDIIQIHGKHIAIHTSILDDKVSAMELLIVYCLELKQFFAPYVEEVMTEIAIESLDFYLHDGVRKTGAKLIPFLLQSLILNQQGIDQIIPLWSLAADKLVDGLSNEPVPDVVMIYHDALSHCMELLGSDYMSASQLNEYAEGTVKNLSELYERVNQRHSDGDLFIEKEDDDLEIEDINDEEILDEINKSLATIFKFKKEKFLPVYALLFEQVLNFLGHELSFMSIFSLVSISDMIMYSGQYSGEFKNLFIDTIISYLLHIEPAIRQGASYCIGCCATSAPTIYLDSCMAAMNNLIKIVSDPESKNDENNMATENAAASIAKILSIYKPEQQDEVLKFWIKSFPILEDKEAAAFNYKFLADLIKQKNPVILQDLSNVINHAIVAVLHSSINDKVAQYVFGALKEAMLGLSPEEVDELFSHYDDKTKAIISKHFN